MKKTRRVHRFKCPHGSVRFVRHPHGYYRFLHKNGRPCRTLSRFTSLLVDAFTPDMDRRPPALEDLVTIFAHMPMSATDLLERANSIVQLRMSLQEYWHRVALENKQERESSIAVVDKKTDEELSGMVQRLTRKEDYSKRRQRVDEIVRALDEVTPTTKGDEDA